MKTNNVFKRFAALTTAVVFCCTINPFSGYALVSHTSREHESLRYEEYDINGRKQLPQDSGTYYLRDGYEFSYDKENYSQDGIDSSGYHQLGANLGQYNRLELCMSGETVSMFLSSKGIVTTSGKIEIVSCEDGSEINCPYGGNPIIKNDGADLSIENVRLDGKETRNPYDYSPGSDGSAKGIDNNSGRLSLYDVEIYTSRTAITANGEYVYVDDSNITSLDSKYTCIDAYNNNTKLLSSTITAEGAGVYCHSGGSVELNNTTVTSNNNVAVICDGTVTLAGATKLTGKNGTDIKIGSNGKLKIIALSSITDPIKISTDVKPTLNHPVVFTESTNTDWNKAENFVSVDSNYQVQKNSDGQLQLALIPDYSYTVTIPASVKLGQTATIKAENVNKGNIQSIKLSLTSTNESDNSLKLTDADTNEKISYTITNLSDNNKNITANTDIISLTGNKDIQLKFNEPPNKIIYPGNYVGTLTFTISVS